MTTTTTTKHRRRKLTSEAARAQALDLAWRTIGPLVPEGTLQWLVLPQRTECLEDYLRRAHDYAAARASWAGGLIGGISAYDDAVIAAVARLV